MKNRKVFYWAMLMPGLLFLVVFMIVPILYILGQSLILEDGTIGLERYCKIFTSLRDWESIALTIGMALLITLISELMAYPAAFLMTHVKSRFLKTLFYVILVSPLLTSVVIRSFAWIVLLTQNGIVNTILMALGVVEKPLSLLWNMQAVIIVYVQVLLPFAVMPLASTMEEIKPDYEKAARSLGAGRIRSFFQITFPLTISGMVSGAVMVFSLAAGSYITALLIGGGKQNILPVKIYQEAIMLMDLSEAGAYSMVLLLVVLVVIIPIEIGLKKWEKKVYG